LSVVEVARLAADCLEIAGRGAAIALGGYGARPSVAEKSANDLVTEFDVATQRLGVIELLSGRFPGVPIIGEEAGREGLEQSRAELVFVVDPIDGTTNFSIGHPFWCVSLGGAPAVADRSRARSSPRACRSLGTATSTRTARPC
jgi:myo-inositol-1(or 4)-monophosphatase